MTTFVTYCSKEKRHSDERLSAIERYESARIRSLYLAALAIGAGFLILSGKYGLVKPSDPIGDYDHRLEPNEVTTHAEKVSAQLEELQVRHITYFTRSVKADEHTRPYLECINTACGKARIPITVVEVEEP